MNKLIEFCLDTENPEKNYRLAQWHEEQGHTGPAHTYYLRAAERSEDKNLSYMSLLRSAICCKKQQTREVTEKSLIDSALVLLPERPEAYYLLCLFYEKKQDWQNCYLYASLGLSCYKNELESIDIPEYKGKYLLIYQKAISSWWWGKGEETRKLYRELVFNYWDEMEEWYQKEVEYKMMCLGSGSESQAIRLYHKNRYNDLRFKFKNSEKIEKNNSQVFQDMFVLSMLNGKKNGTFLEIGGARPFYLNNTALLESEFGWKGISIEFNESFANEYKETRPQTKVLCENALNIDYNQLLTENYDGTIIDYLQLDIEPAKNTYDCMLKIPFDKYKFAVITYEHDYYIDRTQSYREKSRKFLQEKGYVLVVNDISPDGKSNFEDWWVHPDLIDENILNTMSLVNDETKHIENYIFGKPEKIYDISSYEKIIESDKNETWEKYKLVPKEMNTTTPTSKFSFLNNNKNTAWIVDNFYDNPDEIRKFALEQEFGDESVITGFVGRRTFNQFLFPGLKEAFESIMGKKITKWEEHGMNGRFQICWSGERLVYHCDSQKWGGMLYLSPNAPYQCGTTLYADKKNRARTYYDLGWDEYWANTPGDCHLDRTPFEPVDVLGNVYNRLVIFDASCIHSASEYFGTNKENARLWQMFFFDTEK